MSPIIALLRTEEERAWAAYALAARLALNEQTTGPKAWAEQIALLADWESAARLLLNELRSRVAATAVQTSGQGARHAQ